MLWMMVVLALTWDLLGGQMGYNSFGNILFFGIGAYGTAIAQRDFGFAYLEGLFSGIAMSIVIAVVVAAVLGYGILRLRGHYFAIATLGLGIAAGEIAGAWEYVGAGSGMLTPGFPGPIDAGNTFLYYAFFALAVTCFLLLRWLLAARFGLAANAIRDDEDKAESMGLPTTQYKIVAWCIAATFLAVAGGLFGNQQRFIDPRDTAFAGPTLGVWMVLMAILGGKGTLWGPVIGAAIFLLVQELTWTHLLGWQRVALGGFIVAIVIFFPEGVLGWARERWPETFGHRVEEESS
ncbi:MAG: branched-chain amino acid ABC transporter permease [Alphaproteobacteria bacterium]|nr:branched-chain amino acid ABC transporter permease [Alphaproteobacteria bacterium]